MDVKKRKSSIRARDSPGQDRFPWEDEIQTNVFILYRQWVGIVKNKSPINHLTCICKLVKFYVKYMFKNVYIDKTPAYLLRKE